MKTGYLILNGNDPLYIVDTEEYARRLSDVIIGGKYKRLAINPHDIVDNEYLKQFEGMIYYQYILNGDKENGYDFKPCCVPVWHTRFPDKDCKIRIVDKKTLIQIAIYVYAIDEIQAEKKAINIYENNKKQILDEIKDMKAYENNSGTTDINEMDEYWRDH